MMRALLALTFSLALLAGCTAAPASDPAPAASSDLAADPAPGAEAAPAPVPTREEPVQLTGRTQTGLCVGVAGLSSQCSALLPQGTFLMLGPGTDLVRLTGSLTWSATTPATQELYIMVLACDDLEGSSCQNQGEHPFAWGPSPLAIDWDLHNETDQPMAIWVVHYLGQGAKGSYATGMAPQDFTFDGMLETVA